MGLAPSMDTLGFLARGGRAYCNFMCPVGAIDSLANAAAAKLGSPRVVVDPARCNGCEDCLEPCPVWAIEMIDGKARINQLSCMPCGLCDAACPEEAIVRGRT